MSRTVKLLKHLETEVTNIHPSQMGSPDFKIFILNALIKVQETANAEINKNNEAGRGR